MKKIHTAVIQAGGKGTRLKELTRDEIPKPLIDLNGKPMLEWQIENLKKYGITNIILIIGHLGEKIKECFGNGEKIGVSIEYIEEKEPLGSAGALYFLKEMNIENDFFLIFGDVIFDLNLDRMEAFHFNNNAWATLLVHPNMHPYDSDLVVLNEEQKVTSFLLKNVKRDFWYNNCVNAGIYILSKELITSMDKIQKLDLEKDILSVNLNDKNIYGYNTTEYVKDAGTVERFTEVKNALENNIPSMRNLEYKQKCIFLDRDGTINVLKGLISKEEQFELEADVVEAIRLINESGYLAILVTNQPVVARGMSEIEDVERIHRKMMTLLGNEGAYLDDAIFCPHHPDKGYPEENVLYKIKCNCRKPKTGMIDAMVEKYNIDVEQSYMIGDTTIDIQTGINTGTKTVLVQTGEAGNDRKYNVKADMEAKNLLEAIQLILSKDC